MSDPRRFRLADLIPFLLVLATAAGLRVGYMIRYANHAADPGPWLVQDGSPELALGWAEGMPNERRVTEMDALTTNVKESRWFGSLAPFASQEERTAHVAPGYPWLVGEAYRLLPVAVPYEDAEGRPVDPDPRQLADQVLRWLQCVLGTLTAGLYYLIARRAFPGRLVATLAGLLCAVHPFWIVSTPAISDGVLATFLLAACLFFGLRGIQVEGALTCLLFGLALAGLALVRAALLPFGVVLLLWFLRQGRRSPGGWQAGLLAVLGFAIGLAPWFQRNAQAFGDIIPIADSAYYCLWIGNNPQATGGPLSEALQREAVAESPELAAQLARPDLSQPARFASFGPAVLREIESDPTGTIRRRLWAGLYFFFGEDWFRYGTLWRPTDPQASQPRLPPYPELWLGSLLLMLLLGVLGWRWTYAWRTSAQPLALAVMWIPLPYLLGHAEGLCGPRLPLDGVFLCYAAFVLACLAPNVGPGLLRPKKKAED